MYIDSHAHISSDKMLEDIDAVIERAKKSHISKIVNICTDKKSLIKGIELAKKYDCIHNVGATPPHDVLELAEKDLPIFVEALKKKELIAFGETGLDYHYYEETKELQKKYLIKYMKLALKHDVPLVIHCRDAFDDLFDLADQYYNSSKLVLHCFTGTKKDADRAIKRSWLLSFSGILTFKRSEDLRNTIKDLSIENMIVETDCPYLAPQSKRGKRNEPAFLLETVELIAQLKGLSPEQVGSITSQNTRKMFSL